MSHGSSAHGVGVDIGGTKIAAGLVTPDGVMTRVDSEPTPLDADGIAGMVASLVERLREGVAVGGIGIGAAGFVDVDRSTITFAPNIDWIDEPLGADVAGLTGLPVVVENDAAAAAWGEYRFGAGEDTDDLLFVTLGTGVGGGVVHRGTVLRGGFGAAAEIGHIRVVPDGRPCGCGQNGCLEQYASGSALVSVARERVRSGDAGAKPLLDEAGDADGITGPMITALAQAGDALCRDLLAEVGRWAGEGLATLAAVLDPSVIAVGGGVAEAGDLLLEPARRAFEEHLPAREHRKIAEVRLAALGQDAGILGAADLGRIVSHA